MPKVGEYYRTRLDVPISKETVYKVVKVENALMTVFYYHYLNNNIVERSFNLLNEDLETLQKFKLSNLEIELL